MTPPEALAAFDAAADEVGVRNVLLLDRLRGAFVRRITANTEGHAMTKEVMRQALEALEALPGKIMNVSADGATLDWASTREAYLYGHRDARHAAAEIASSFIAALRTALDAPQQPVAWMTTDEEGSPAMLFFDYDEALTYCDCGVDKPVALIPAPKD